MAKNITIYPSNSTQLADRIPHIDFIGTGNNNILSIRVLNTGILAFSGNSASPNFISIYVDPTNSVISGDTLNVKDYFSVGGTQVINGTANWIGPTTNIAGAQGATGPQGKTGAQGPQGSTGAQGAQGSANVTGSQGGTGNTGAQGSQGATNVQGAQGGKGAVGNTVLKEQQEIQVLKVHKEQ